jgi:NAD(P)H-quinone oxidoreductase subunit 4
MLSTFPWLTATILLPLVAAAMIPVIPDKEGKTVRWYALGAALANFGLIIYTISTQYKFQAPGYQLVENFAWIPTLNLNWSLAIDGVSMPLVVLTALVTTLSILAGHVQRPARRVLCPRFIAVLLNLGT